MPVSIETIIELAATVVIAAFGLGRLLGFWSHKLELKDWAEWRKGIERRMDDVETAMDQANAECSRLSSEVQTLPQRIEDRIGARYTPGRELQVEFEAIKRDIQRIETRCQRFLNGRGHV